MTKKFIRSIVVAALPASTLGAPQVVAADKPEVRLDQNADAKTRAFA
ncbi:hypothetical protein ACNPQM_33415 [Streptomyces sp. NPDC056231]